MASYYRKLSADMKMKNYKIKTSFVNRGKLSAISKIQNYTCFFRMAKTTSNPANSKSHFLKPKNLLSRSSQGKVGLSKRLDKVPLESLQSIEHGQTSGTNNTSNIMQSRSFAYAQFDNMDTNYTSKTKLGVANSRPITAIPKIKS